MDDVVSDVVCEFREHCACLLVCEGAHFDLGKGAGRVVYEGTESGANAVDCRVRGCDRKWYADEWKFTLAVSLLPPAKILLDATRNILMPRDNSRAHNTHNLSTTPSRANCVTAVNMSQYLNRGSLVATAAVAAVASCAVCLWASPSRPKEYKDRLRGPQKDLGEDVTMDMDMYEDEQSWGVSWSPV